MNSRTCLFVLTFCVPYLSALAAEGVPAGYPSRPVRVVVPQSPGGFTDITARLFTAALAERLGQSLVVDNRPGAGSMLGTDLVAKATPDGYTVLVVASSIVLFPSMYKKVPFDLVRDFAPVTTLTSYPNLVVVLPSLAANSIKELIALAKAKPGILNFGSGGIGTPTQLGPELLKSMAGIDVVHVPYKGGGPALNALLGGQVQFYFGPIAAMLPQVKAGKLKALAVTSAQRAQVVSDVPTMAQAGVPGFEQITWNALLAPAQTPAAIIRKLNSEGIAVLKSPAIRKRLITSGVEPGGTSPKELGALIKSDTAKWGRVIREAGIKPE